MTWTNNNENYIDFQYFISFLDLGEFDYGDELQTLEAARVWREQRLVESWRWTRHPQHSQNQRHLGSPLQTSHLREEVLGSGKESSNFFSFS